jgi:hypothetical protein
MQELLQNAEEGNTIASLNPICGDESPKPGNADGNRQEGFNLPEACGIGSAHFHRVRSELEGRIMRFVKAKTGDWDNEPWAYINSDRIVSIENDETGFARIETMNGSIYLTDQLAEDIVKLLEDSIWPEERWTITEDSK